MKVAFVDYPVIVTGGDLIVFKTRTSVFIKICMDTYFVYQGNQPAMVPPGAIRGYSPKIAGSGKKLHGILMSGCVIFFIVIMVYFAGCASAPPVTTQSTIPATTVLPVVTERVPALTASMNSSSHLTSVPSTVPASLPVSVPSHPILGTWSFTDTEGILATLTFSENGRFSGTIGGELSPDGTWKPVKENEYAVILSSGESWNYIYDADSDILYDVSYPDVSFTRQYS